MQRGYYREKAKKNKKHYLSSYSFNIIYYLLDVLEADFFPEPSP